MVKGSRKVISFSAEVVCAKWCEEKKPINLMLVLEEKSGINRGKRHHFLGPQRVFQPGLE